VARWKEGIDYELLEDGRVKCGYCGKTLKSKAAIGPHLAVCPERKRANKARGEGVSPKKIEKAEVPEEGEVLKEILVTFGLQEARAEGIVKLMAYAGWDNYAELRYYLDCAGLSPDRQVLVLKAWSNHRGTAVPPHLLQEIHFAKEAQRWQTWYATNPYFNPYYAPTSNAPFVTKEDLEKILDEKLKESKNSDVVKMLLEDRKILLDRVLSEKNSPSLTDQLRFIEMVAERLGYSKGGKNIFDLLDKGINTVDKRVEEGFKIMQGQLSSASFSYPAENLRTPEMRQQIAKKMTSGLNETLKFVKVVETEFLGMGSQKVKREMKRK